MFIHLYFLSRQVQWTILSIFGTFRKWVWQLSKAQVRGISIGTFWKFTAVTTGQFSILTNTFSFCLSQHQLRIEKNINFINCETSETPRSENCWSDLKNFIWTFSYVLTLRLITVMIYRVISRDICLGMFGHLLGELGAFLRIS